MMTLRLECDDCGWFPDIAQAACRIATTLLVIVAFNYRGKEIKVFPHDKPETVFPPGGSREQKT